MNSLDETADLVMGVIHFRIGSREDIGRESPLFEGGLGLDSIGFLELLLEIEQTCGKRLRDETLTEDAVANVGSLIQYIHSLEPC
jgi:acyl carrier protein